MNKSRSGLRVVPELLLNSQPRGALPTPAPRGFFEAYELGLSSKDNKCYPYHDERFVNLIEGFDKQERHYAVVSWMEGWFRKNAPLEGLQNITPAVEDDRLEVPFGIWIKPSEGPNEVSRSGVGPTESAQQRRSRF